MSRKVKVGRPTSYRKNFPERAERLWAAGAIDIEVCEALRISHETLNQYQKRYPEFLAAKLRAKRLADELIEKALFKRAMGFTAPDSHVSQFEGGITVTPLERHYPPDTEACKFWLKNRRPDQWREKSEMTLQTEIAGLPEDVLNGLRQAFAKGPSPHTTRNGKTPYKSNGEEINGSKTR